MSRRGDRDSDNVPHNWSKPSNKVPRPRGLRGKDIGLYYKNQQLRMKGNKTPRGDIIIRLTVPPPVITALENNIKTIHELAKVCNISIPDYPGLIFTKCETPQQDEDVSSSKSKKSDHRSKSKSKKNLLQSSASTSATDEFKPCNSSDDTTSSIKTNKVQDECIDLNSDNASNNIITENIINEPVTKTLEDIKAEPMDTSNERLLSLRGAGDFKYGYEDIITGTFDDKLDACISNGVLITKKTQEIDDLSLALYQDYLNMLKADAYKKYKAFRETLPTYKKSKDLIEVINNNQVVVINGETGCGKSTQVPQLILDDAIINKKGGYVKILVTQPRRIAASSLAMRVAAERSENIGASVGYAVRLEKVESRGRGSIMFCTTGILLSTLETDQGLTNYTHIILDEVHERECDTDLAMFMLTKVLRKRKDLKLILMSATLDADTLSAYFGNCPMIHIEGLAFPVNDIYLERVLEITKFKLPPEQKRNFKNSQARHKKKRMATEMEKDIRYKANIGPWLESIKRTISYDTYKTLQDHRIEEMNLDLIYALLVEVCKGPPGAILVFLPGIAEISRLLRLMQEGPHFPSSRYDIHPLHSKLSSLQQHKIFERPPSHMRKIIVSTNIAETSITIDDIVYVIDSGRMKYNGLNVEQNISTLQVEWISQANLRQRRGRAGRCQPGTCYHLLTSYRASVLEERILPELQRNPLLEPVLSLKRLRLGKARKAFKLMPAPPAATTVASAVKHLQQCGAIDFAEKLTPLGWHIARLPVHPAAGKLLLLGALFGCLDRAASVAAVWGFKDPFHLVIGKEDEADEAKKSFALGEGSDHVAISEAIMQWESQSSAAQRRSFAYTNFLNNNTLELLVDMKKQLGNNLQEMGFLPSGNVYSQWENRNTNNLSLFKAVVAASLYPNVATTKWKNLNARNSHKVIGVKARTVEDGAIYIHPSSVMAERRPKRGGYPIGPACFSPGANWLVFWHKQRSTELYLLEVTLIHTLPLLFFGELSVSEAVNPDECYISIASIKVWCNRHTADLLCQMKALLDQVLASKIGVCSSHSTTHNTFEEHVLNAVKELITAEDGGAEYLDEPEEASESDNSELE